jgi:hypothetical protein
VCGAELDEGFVPVSLRGCLMRTTSARSRDICVLEFQTDSSCLRPDAMTPEMQVRQP